jgi:hypothetical protein
MKLGIGEEENDSSSKLNLLFLLVKLLKKLTRHFGNVWLLVFCGV